MEEDDIQIFVPWGQISCKTFGDKSQPVVVLLHDLHDNAASFDLLAEHLHDTHFYVAVDLPGHGKSSHFQPHAVYHFIDYLLALKYILIGLAKHVRRSHKVALIGHGLSAHLAIVFTQIYPILVERVCLLENVYHYGTKVQNFKRKLRENHQFYFKVERDRFRRSPSEYEFGEVVQMYEEKYAHREIAERLAVRSSRRIENGKFLLTNDERLRVMWMHTCGYDYSLDFLQKQPVVCPLLILCSKRMKRQFADLLAVLRRKSANVQVVTMKTDGLFHVHEPQEVAGYVNAFLAGKRNKL